MRLTFENRLLSLGEGPVSLLLQTPPIYKCLHYHINQLLEVLEQHLFSPGNDAGLLLAGGPLFFPLILL